MLRPRDCTQSPESRAAALRHRPGATLLRDEAQLSLAIVVPFLVACVGIAGCQDTDVPAEWTVELEEVLTVGAEPVTRETALFLPAALGFDFKNRLFVLDSGNHRIQIFDLAGRFLASLGSYGNAPGQLASPMGMYVYPDGSLVVADARNQRLQPFGAAGAPLDPISLEFPPLDVVGTKDRLFVLRLAQASMIMGPDKRGLVHVLDRASGAPLGAFVEAVEAKAGVLYLLRNSYGMAPGPAGGLALCDLHFASRIRLYSARGTLRREIPVLYKAAAWAPLGREPDALNDRTIETIARTASDMAWDPLRQVYWVLSGYTDRDPDGEWIIGHELYRYDANGVYRGSAMLPFRGTVLAVAPDGRVWITDIDGVVHAFLVRDPDMESLIDRPPA
jgi:hypothetical protein